MDISVWKWTETDRNLRKGKETDRNRQNRKEKERKGQKQKETERNGQKWIDQTQKEKMSDVMCHNSPVICHLSSVTNANSHSHRPAHRPTDPLCIVAWGQFSENITIYYISVHAQFCIQVLTDSGVDTCCSSKCECVSPVSDPDSQTLLASHWLLPANKGSYRSSQPRPKQKTIEKVVDAVYYHTF